MTPEEEPLKKTFLPKEVSLRKKRHRKLLLLGGILFVLLLLLAGGDAWCEIFGLPEFLHKRAERTLAPIEFQLRARKIFIGLVHGIVLEQAEIFNSENGVDLQAERFQINLFPRRFLRGVALPLDVRLKNGTLQIRVFPENGEEGAADTLVFTNLRASVLGTKGQIMVREADGILNGIHFRMSGNIDNLLHLSLVRLLGKVQESVSMAPNLRKKEDIVKIGAFIRNIPVLFRKRIMLLLERAGQKKFDGEPFCWVRFSLDLEDFSKCRSSVKIRIPGFRCGHLYIDSFQADTCLEDGILTTDKAVFQFGRNAGGESRTELSMRYDRSIKALKGKISGKCRPEEILFFLNKQTQDEIAEKLRFLDGMAEFDGRLDQFSLLNGFAKGELHVMIPGMEIDGVRMHSVRIALNLKNETVSGTLERAELDNGGTISGTFRISGSRFESTIEGAAPVSDIEKFFSAETLENIRPVLHFPSGKSLIAFSGKLNAEDWNSSRFSGALRLLLREFNLFGMDFKRAEASFRFEDDVIRADSITAVLLDGSVLQGNMDTIPAEKKFAAGIICSGSPSRILQTINPPARDVLQKLTGDIAWPKGGDMLEGAIDVYADFGEKPFFFLNGNLVMKNYSYRKIPFRYGAARFLVTADQTVLLPDVVLETNEGTFHMCGAYRPQDRDLLSGRPGELNFKLTSSLTGNDLIHLLYPTWKSEFIDFPFSMPVTTTGKLDYGDERKTEYTSVVTNGDGIFGGIRIQDIDTKLRYEHEKLSLQNAESMISGGRATTSYEYDFLTEKGKISCNFMGADFRKLLSESGYRDLLEREKNFSGFLSGSIAADLSFNEKDELLLDGKGHMQLTGDDLWTIPLMSAFLKSISKVWTLEQFGSITKVDCNFTLDKDVMHVREMKSNGGVVSLKAEGKYRWTQKDFEFYFQAELLKNVLPLGIFTKLFYPISWTMRRKLTGNANGYEWK